MPLFAVFQSLSCVWFFTTPWAAAPQASLSFTMSQRLLKFCLLNRWCHTTISSSATLFSFCFQSFPESVSFPKSALHIRWPKYWSFSISPSDEHSEFISFKIDWFALLAVQETLKSLLQHYSLKTSILQCAVFFMVQLSHPYLTIGKTVAFTIWTLVGKVISLFFNTLSRFAIAFLPGPSIF